MAFPPKIQRQIIADNLHIQERAISSTLEARRSHISDLARVLEQSLPSGKILAHDISDIVGTNPLLDARETTLHREALEESHRYLKGVLTSLSHADRAVLSTFLARRLRDCGREMNIADFLPESSKGSRIAYARNNYIDEAYDVFSSDLNCPTALYTDGYEASCLAVKSQDASFCILPFRDARGDYVRATYALLREYDMIVCGAYSMQDGSGETITYALCGTTPLYTQGPFTLLVTLPGYDHAHLAEFCEVTALYDMTPQDLHCARDLNVTLTGDGDLVPFFIWLTLFATGYRVDGLYSSTAS